VSSLGSPAAEHRPHRPEYVATTSGQGCAEGGLFQAGIATAPRLVDAVSQFGGPGRLGSLRTRSEVRPLPDWGDPVRTGFGGHTWN
jgi:hypothetical protein